MKSEIEKVRERERETVRGLGLLRDSVCDSVKVNW